MVRLPAARARHLADAVALTQAVPWALRGGGRRFSRRRSRIHCLRRLSITNKAHFITLPSPLSMSLSHRGAEVKGGLKENGSPPLERQGRWENPTKTNVGTRA